MGRQPPVNMHEWKRGVMGVHERSRTVTLAEFLLARIAEDEESVITMDCTCGHRDAHSLPAADCPERVLAECEAQRRIVERWHRTAVAGALYPGDRGTFRELGAVLAILATTHADHPDYDEAWRL